ncbi:MAG TPA: VWA domain-containing protein [Candidatus Angelobacter sp.]|nr:VWA domain-containing protein [Candidatus Angelobacter sp.]
MVGFRKWASMLACLLLLLSVPLVAQQGVPDAPAPKATQPNQFPDNAPPAPKNTRPTDATPPAEATPSSVPAQPQGPDALTTDLKQFGKFTTVVNFVQVPVTVRESSGKLVEGLGPADFTIYEDGVPQRLKFFSSDSFPLTAAVVIFTDLPVSTMKKVNQSLPALIGAFSQYDEVALYRYGHTVSQVAGFTAAESLPTATLARVKGTGRPGGPPAIFGPLAQGPSINGHPADPGQPGPQVANLPPPVQESFVLNDAILRAAQDLSRRDRSRRKIIFVVSDGRELGSVASFDEVRKVLLSNNISVYALGVDTAAIPVYDKLGRLRVPGFGYANILPKYATATGGDIFAEFDRQSIEQAYAKITAAARNQYTLGYSAKATPSTSYRTIDVRVHRPNLVVTAKEGYYPLPTQGPQQPQPQQQPATPNR